MELNKIYLGDNIETLKSLPDESVDCCITSPPYYGLRDYGTGEWVGGDPNCPHARLNKVGDSCTTGHAQDGLQGNVGDAIYKTVCPLCGAVREDKQVGLEETPEEYIDRLVGIFREVKRVLKSEGTLWVNIGDTYYGSGGGRGSTYHDGRTDVVQSGNKGFNDMLFAPVLTKPHDELKNKDMIGIPWMLAFALRKDGWYLRQDIIWCLSGGTYLYVRSQKGVQPMMIKDMIRLDSKTVQLWNGEKWVNVLGWGRSTNNQTKLEINLRSGERIQCTAGHRWVLEDGTEKLASELSVGDVLLTTRFKDEGTHTPSILTSDVLWLIGLYIAEGSIYEDRISLALNVDELPWVERIRNTVESLGGTITYNVEGNNLSISIHSQIFIAILHQYVWGKTAKTKHLNNICWKMSNEMLRHLITGYFDGDGSYDTDNNRVRLGFTRNYDWERDLRLLANRLGATITLKLSRSKCNGKYFLSFRGEWRWGISDHFNNKKRSEIISIKSGRGRNYYDISVDCDNHLFALSSGVLTHNCKPNPMPESVKDRCTRTHEYIFLLAKSSKYYFDYKAIMEPCTDQSRTNYACGSGKISLNLDRNDNDLAERSKDFTPEEIDGTKVRNKRDVWTVNPAHYKEAHFATFPEELIAPMVLAGCPSEGVVLDPFMGSGTTAVVAKKNSRNYIGCELNPEYVEMAENRIKGVNKRLFAL